MSLPADLAAAEAELLTALESALASQSKGRWTLDLRFEGLRLAPVPCACNGSWINPNGVANCSLPMLVQRPWPSGMPLTRPMRLPAFRIAIAASCRRRAAC